ncbi:MAG: hypothetical protein U5K69_30025 [Balneolaceae bacterium]|nr:hypothetical protein [Balneolaceae bacterium]
MGKKKSSYKYSRSRKPWTIKKIRLRIQDAMRAIEPVFLGTAGEDYDPDEMERMMKAAHAYSQLGSKLRKLTELDEIIERVESLEEQINPKT